MGRLRHRILPDSNSFSLKNVSRSYDPRSPIPDPRSRWFRICCGAFFVAFAGAISFRYFSPRTTLVEGTLSSSASLRIVPTALNVGTVWPDQVLRHSMVVMGTNAKKRFSVKVTEDMCGLVEEVDHESNQLLASDCGSSSSFVRRACPKCFQQLWG